MHDRVLKVKATAFCCLLLVMNLVHDLVHFIGLQDPLKDQAVTAMPCLSFKFELSTLRCSQVTVLPDVMYPRSNMTCSGAVPLKPGPQVMACPDL